MGADRIEIPQGYALDEALAVLSRLHLSVNSSRLYDISEDILADLLGVSVR